MRKFIPLALLLSGCLNQAYVEADVATFNAVAGEYMIYVAQDPKLDAGQRRRRANTIRSWEARLTAAGSPATSKPHTEGD